MMRGTQGPWLRRKPPRGLETSALTMNMEKNLKRTDALRMIVLCQMWARSTFPKGRTDDQGIRRTYISSTWTTSANMVYIMLTPTGDPPPMNCQMNDQRYAHMGTGK